MKDILAVAMFVLGLILVMNEGQWFPWVNLFGTALVGATAVLLGKEED